MHTNNRMKQVCLVSPVSLREIDARLEALSVHREGREIMNRKAVYYTFRITSLSAPAANILKQEALAAGAELATAWSVIKATDTISDALLMGTYRQLGLITDKIASQQFGLPSIADELRTALDNLFQEHRTFRCRTAVLDFSGRPKLMGILNVTPDSFSDGGRYFSPEAAVEHGLALCGEGADLLDIGGESTKPGSAPVSAEEEKRRVIPVIRELRKRVGIPLSVDTTKAAVAAAALDNGADIVNDISAMTIDPGMSGVVKKFGAGVVLMHMQGTPATMQSNPSYTDVVLEVLSYLEERARYAINEAGIERECIAVDPGIGFGKTIDHNLALLKDIRAFRTLGFPVLAGTSRKSFIGRLTGTDTGERVPGSLATAVWAATHGVDIIRVHDIRETKQALSMINHILDA